MSTDTYNQLKPHNPNLSSSIVFFERMKQMPPVESETKYDIIKRLYAHVTHHADAVLYILLIYNVSLATENMYMYRTYITCILYSVYGIYVLRTFLIIDATTPNLEITYCLENKNYIIYTRMQYLLYIYK